MAGDGSLSVPSETNSAKYQSGPGNLALAPHLSDPALLCPGPGCQGSGGWRVAIVSVPPPADIAAPSNDTRA
jgi:hypothetical protein